MAEPRKWRELLQEVHARVDRGDGIALSDRDGKTEYVSPAVHLMLGYTQEEIVGQLNLVKMHPEDAPAARAGFQQLLLEPGGTRSFIGRILHKDGSYRWIETTVTNFLDDPTIGAVMTHFRDVSETMTVRRELDETVRALRRSETNFRVLVERAPVAVLVQRGETIRYANPAMAQLLRTPAEDLVGKSAWSIVPAHRRSSVKDRIAVLERTPGNPHVPRIEGELERPDGTLVAVEVEGIKLDFDGQPSLVVLAHDITDRRAMLARLAASDRLAALGVLAAGVAHEINNPLAFLQTNLHVLSERLTPEDASTEIASMLADAREGASRIESLVRDLRSFARSDGTDDRPVDVREVLESCMRMAQNEIRPRANLVALIGDVPLAAGSSSRLGQVFLNLLINAAQSIPEGRPGDHEVRVVAYRAASGSVVVEVSDTGTGIASDVLGHVFDPFFTTKPHGVGTGLGLWICHGIVKSAGGEISVESSVGRGSTFRVVLRAWTGAEQRRDAHARLPKRSRKRLRVLVIDDERAIGASLELLLEADHEVTAVTEARDALDAIRGGATCDVILCDLMMPRMSGMEFYEALQELAPAYAPRVVFVTGGAFTPASRSFLERVPNRRLEKPFDLDALHAALDAVADESDSLSSEAAP